MRRSQCARAPRSLLVGLFLLPLFGATPGRGEDSWDAVFISGTKVGFIHTYVQPVKDRGRELLRVRVDMQFTYKRGEDTNHVETQYGSIETPDGTVLKIDTRTLASKNEMRTWGNVIDGKMTLTLEGSGQPQHEVIPWGPEVRGPYAPEQSLSRQPIKPGESRTLRMYVPDLSKLCDVTLVAKGPEEVILGDGKRALLRVEHTLSINGKPRPELSVTLWVDSAGQVLKSHSDYNEGMDTYRTTEAGAKAGVGAGRLNLIATSVAKVIHKIDKPYASRHILYRLKLKDEDPVPLFPTDRRQSIRSGSSKNEAILEIKIAGPNDGAPGPASVDPEYLRPNALITSKDRTVVGLAAKAVTNAVDPWDKAVRIEKWVATNLVNKNFEIGFAPANEVAENLAGDCTEHSVLSAAMCRAQGIPARVVVGLVYADHLGGFGYHMWNEVYINRRWVALDSAFDESSVDAVHIKLSETSLDGVSPYESFLPVVRVMGRLTIEPIEIR